MKHETSVGNYARTRHVIRHLSLTGGGTGATVRMNCGTNSVGERRMALQNLWAVWRHGAVNVDGRWMEMSADYSCGSDGVYRRRVRWEYHWDTAGVIRWYTDISDTNTHTYLLLHNNANGPNRWTWSYDGTAVAHLDFTSHAPHAIDVRDGLEVNDKTTNVFVGKHQYDSLSYGTKDEDGSMVYATRDSLHYDPGVTGYLHVSGSNHYGCKSGSDSC